MFLKPSSILPSLRKLTRLTTKVGISVSKIAVWISVKIAIIGVGIKAKPKPILPCTKAAIISTIDATIKKSKSKINLIKKIN